MTHPPHHLDRHALLAASGATASNSQARNATPNGAHAFDFLVGQWRVEHRRLQRRLVNDTRWETFEGSCEARLIMGGLGNIDDNVLELPAGTYRAATIRQYNPAKDIWSIWWMDARHPGLDAPVVGRFVDGVGVFTSEDTLDGLPIHVRFVWSRITATSAQWEQAFAPATQPEAWETNWTMQFRRKD